MSNPNNIQVITDAEGTRFTAGPGEVDLGVGDVVEVDGERLLVVKINTPLTPAGKGASTYWLRAPRAPVAE